MIYAELAGGLGNQMFIYAFARALGLRCGEPILKEWAKDPAKGLTFYPAGSNGPEERKWLLHYSL